MTTTLADLEKRVDALEKKAAQDGRSRSDKVLRDRVEGIADHIYGTNVRPPLRERGDDEYPADVVPTSADEGTDQFKKDVSG